MALRGALCPTGRMALWGTLEEILNEAECVGREFQWIRMTWKRILMKPSVLEENSNGPDDLEENSNETESVRRVHNLGFVKQS